MSYGDKSPRRSGAIYDNSMNLAGRQSTQPFKDLRSARRARNRDRTRSVKYYHFKGITPADLPSADHQKPHYIPICRTHNKPDGHDFSTFPADLNKAPVSKFTKREAWEEAQQWPRPPTYHRSHRWDKRSPSVKDLRDEKKKFEGWQQDVWLAEHLDRIDWSREVDKGDHWCNICQKQHDPVTGLSPEHAEKYREYYWDPYLGQENEEGPVKDPPEEDQDNDEDDGIDWDILSVSSQMSWITV